MSSGVEVFEVWYDLPVVFVPTAQAGARLVERWAFHFARETVGGNQRPTQAGCLHPKMAQYQLQQNSRLIRLIGANASN